MKTQLFSRVLSLTLASTLALALALAPLARSEDDSSSGVTNALKNVSSGLGVMGNAVGAIGASQQQMQAMVNQIAGLQAQQNLMNQNLGALDQVKARLATALAEAQTCVVNAEKDVSKFKKNNIAPGAITTTDPTCRNYGNVIDSAKANILKMNEANAKIGCLRTFQDKVNAAAESAKAPFGALTKAAQEAWNIRDQIITMHKGIAEKLHNDMEGRDGYKAKLAELKKLSIELNNVLNAKPGGTSDNGLSTGLARKAENLKRLRTMGAKQWHSSIMEDTQRCFYSDRSKGCDSSGTPASPYECIQRALNPPTRNNPGQAARNKYNQGELGEVFALNMGKINQLETDANVDVKNIPAFLKFSADRYTAIAVASARTLADRKFQGNINGLGLAAFMRSKLDSCYSSAIDRFRSGLQSEGNQYKGVLNQIEDQEKDLANETKVWIETVTKQMNEFKTSFEKTYNNGLPQFTANCTVNEDPYTSVDCLRVMAVTLKSGIEGTAQSIKLGNGTYYTSNEGVTTLNVQGITTDPQSGSPSLSTNQVQCRGFNECLTFLEKSKTHHEEQVQQQTQAREKFVADHNKNVDTAMQSMAPQFTAITDLISRSVGQINESLSKSGVNAQVKTKQVDGETLSQNEKTKLYDMPKNMKSALAATGAYTEIEETSEVTTGLNTRLGELNKKVNEAFRKKAQCTVKKSEYESLAGYLPAQCDEGKIVCRSNRVTGMMNPLEGLLRKTGANPDNDSKGEIARNYNSCLRSVKGGSSDNADQIANLREELRIETDATKKPDILKEIRQLQAEGREDASEERKQCGEQALGSLDALAREARNDTYNGNNRKVLEALRALNEACNPPTPTPPERTPGAPRPPRVEPSFDGATEACEALKSAAKEAKIPDGEGETPDTGTGSGSSTTNPIRNSSGAQ